MNGKRHGYGKEYNSEGKLIFEGEYRNGKRNGSGKEYFDNNIKFIGSYLNNKRIIGKYYKLCSGDSKHYKKIYKLNLTEGFVKEYDESLNFIFEGIYSNCQRDGERKGILSKWQFKI